jgi:pimeloyl-ACP methyl ester carboxylesterase
MQVESYYAFSDHGALAPPVPKSPTPVFLVHGLADGISLRRHQALARRYNATLEIVPLGHELMLESPWRSVADRILAWLAASTPLVR